MTINNLLYDELGEKWYQAKDNPVALLRAESKIKNPWVQKTIHQHFQNLQNSQNFQNSQNSQNKIIKIIDVGCGGGLLSNFLSLYEYDVTGIDLSMESLKIAQKYDHTQKVKYQYGNAYHLPYPDQSFDVVTSMDFLEHVEHPDLVITEISRVLKPNGLFIFHTFNKNWIAGFLVIKMVEWFVKNTPPQMHVYQLFISPKLLSQYCLQNNLTVATMVGIRPQIFNKSFFKSLFTREIDEDFKFKLTSSLLISYMGYAVKN